MDGYIAKSDLFIVMVSTPYIPESLFENIGFAKQYL
jgi:hypothetical protein